MNFRVAILAYHSIAAAGPADLAPFRVSPSAFSEQLEFLRREGYCSISITDWVFSIITRRFLPGRPIIITFDDGYRDFITAAWPVLRRTNFRATIFVVTGRVGGLADWDRTGAPLALMDWNELRAMQREGNMIGSHCNLHRNLTRLSDEAIVADGIAARDALRRELGTEVVNVAFPWGISDARVRRALAKAGYSAGLGVGGGPSSFSDDVLRLPRIEIFSGDDLDAFARKVDDRRFRAGIGRGEHRREAAVDADDGSKTAQLPVGAGWAGHKTLETLAARIDRLVEELVSIKRELLDRTTHPDMLQNTLQQLFSQPLTGPMPIRLTPHQMVSPGVRIGFEGSAEADFAVVDRLGEASRPQAWPSSLRFSFNGPSRWFSLDVVLAWPELHDARRYQLGITIRSDRPVTSRGVVRMWQKDGHYREIELAAFDAAPDETSHNLSGTIELPDSLNTDYNSDPMFLLLFDTTAPVEVELSYLNLYFA